MAEDIEEALDLVNLINLNWDDTVKGRACENGLRERMCLKEFESASSPRALLESLLLMFLIGVCEKRNLMSYNVPGVFLQGEIEKDKLLLLKLKGNRLVDMMCKINLDRMPNVKHEVNVKVLHLKEIREIYGCIEVVLQ